jgi:hypothetical protein
VISYEIAGAFFSRFTEGISGGILFRWQSPRRSRHDLRDEPLVVLHPNPLGDAW